MPVNFSWGNFEHLKASFVADLYISAADDDYLNARWCFSRGLFRNFYWSSAQAIEKYAKSILLLNNLSTIDHRHNLKKLIQDVRLIDKEEIFGHEIMLPKMTGVITSERKCQNVDGFIEYLLTYGSSENRYAFEGTHITEPIIHCVDSVCCSLRSLVRIYNKFGAEIEGVLDV